MSLTRTTSIRGFAVGLLLATSPMVTGCARTLAAQEATAFETMASADREAFDDLTEAEQAARVRYAQRAVRASKGVVNIKGCEPTLAGDCQVSYSLGVATIPLAQSAPKARATLAAISRYGEQMAELAEAKDLSDVQSKAEAAGGAVKSLILTVTPAAPLALIAGPIVDAAVFASKASLVSKRRCCGRPRQNGGAAAGRHHARRVARGLRSQAGD